jgi:hypothetical protein
MTPTRPSGLMTSGAQQHQTPTRKDILVSRYVYRTLVHDTTMTGSSVEDPYRGPPPTTQLGLSAEQTRILGW